MKTNLLLSVLLSPSLIYIVTSARPRIIEGEFALPGEFPYVVSLQFITEFDCTHPFCGGSILDEYHIITAAHCAFATDYALTRTYDLRNEITIVAGTTDLSNKTIGIYRGVQKMFIPTSYGYEKGEIYDDIAILKLKHPLPLGDHESLSAVQLPNADEYLPPDTFDGSIAGFGTNTQTLNTITGELESEPPVPYLKYARGVINAPNESYQCDSGEICFETYGFSNGHLEGPCQGDSGGPLVIHGSNILVGIDSYSRNVTCGMRNTFTRVSEYLDFIKMVLDDDIDETVVPVELTLDAEDNHPNIPLCEF